MRPFLLLLFCVVLVGAEGSSFDQLLDPPVKDTVKRYNPGITTALSLIPGGGQIYTKNYVRGGLFLATEALVGTQAYIRWRNYRDYRDNYNYYLGEYRTGVSTFNLIPDSLLVAEDTLALLGSLDIKHYAEYNLELKRIEYVNYAGWFTGIYLWNLADAFGASNRFSGSSNPSPKRAALLSAIPFTGAGQFYNGRFFKGAMVSVVEIGCMVSAINFQRLMNDAEGYGDKLYREIPDDSSATYDYKRYLNGNLASWEGRYDREARRRTMFMWYGIFFYLYGIADAAVDAHLHDFERNFDISGGVDPVSGEISFAFSGEFGRRSRRCD